MAVQTSFLNTLADAGGADITALSLHSADGSTTGANELTGGTYARVTPDYSTPSTAGEVDLADPVTFNGPGSQTTATHLGFWAGSTWRGSVALAASKVLTSTDTLEITSAPITVAAAA